MKVGYVRVSSQEQNTARQDELMKQLGVEKIYTDKTSGKSMDRPELNKMMEFVRQGDVLIVESISRFARNTKDLLELIEQLEKKEVQFISQKEYIDTSSATGRFMLTIFGAVAELERAYIKDRQKEGIELAKAEGVHLGRPIKAVDCFDAVYADWVSKKITAKQASSILKVSRSTFYRYVKTHQSPHSIER